MSDTDKIKQELLKITNIKPGHGETSESYTWRALKKALSMSEEKWDELSTVTQEWANAQILLMDAIDKAAKAEEEYEGEVMDLIALPASATKPDEVDDSDDDTADEASDDSTQQEAEVTATTKTTRTKKKVSPKKAAKKATAAPAKKAAPAKAPAKAVKKAAGAKAPAKKAASKANGSGRGRKALYTPDQKIKLLVKENPYREGTLGHKVFAKYRDGIAVGEFAGKVKALSPKRPPAALLRFDVGKGYVKVA